MKSKIESLQVVRAMACILVILDHTEMGHFYNIGQFGVCLFLIISGFVMLLSTEKSTNNLFIKRFFRIAPLYYLITVLTIVLGLIVPQFMRVSEVNLFNAVKSFLFVSIKGSNGIYNPILGVGWTLNLEMAFYVVFAISTRISKKYRALISGVVLLGLNVLYYCFGVDHFYTQPYIIFIVFGMILYYCYKYTADVHISKTIQYFGCVLASLICVAVVVINPKMELRWMLPTATICVSLFVLVTKEIRHSRLLVYIGNISYSIYLTHTFVIKGFVRIIRPVKELTFLNIVFVTVYVFAAIFVGALVYSLVEKQLVKKTNKLLSYL